VALNSFLGALTKIAVTFLPVFTFYVSLALLVFAGYSVFAYGTAVSRKIDMLNTGWALFNITHRSGTHRKATHAYTIGATIFAGPPFHCIMKE